MNRLVNGSGSFEADAPGFWYACAEDETTHQGVSLPTVSEPLGTNPAVNVSVPMAVINTAQYPTTPGLLGLEPWSAQIGSATTEAPTLAGGHQQLYGICYDFTVPTGGYLSFWAKQVGNEPIGEPDAPGAVLKGFQAAAILPQTVGTTGNFPVQPLQWLYQMQGNSGLQGTDASGWANYGFDLGTKFAGQPVTLFFGIESPGIGTELEQFIAGVSVTQAHNMNLAPVDQLAATNGLAISAASGTDINYEATVVGTTVTTPEAISRGTGTTYSHDFAYVSAPFFTAPTLAAGETAGEATLPPEVVIDSGIQAQGLETATMTGNATATDDGTLALVGTMGEVYHGLNRAGGDLVVAHGQLYVDNACTQSPIARCHGIHFLHRNSPPSSSHNTVTYDGYIQINGTIFR